MKRKKIARKARIGIFFLLFGIFLVGCNQKITSMPLKATTKMDYHPASQSSNPAIQEGNLGLSIHYGMENNAKLGRYLRVRADVANQGESFKGKLNLFWPIDPANNILYQKNVEFWQGQIQTINIDVPYFSIVEEVAFQLISEDGKKIIDQIVKVPLVTSDKMYVGILSDHPNDLNYLESSMVKLFHLNANSFPDKEEGIDILDIVIIDDYNTKNLNESQYQALKDWVRQGGSLLLGTGSSYKKTLGLFHDNFIPRHVGALNEDGFLDITIESGKEVLKTEEGAAYQILEKGKGAIHVTNFKLREDTVEKNILKHGSFFDFFVGNTRKQSWEERNNRYDLYQSLGLIDKSNLPKTKGYAVILGIYVTLAGPILYLFLKKKDKRSLIWMVIPGLAILFSLIIYIVGNNTRIKDPVLNYIQLITLTDSNGRGEEETLFNLMAPYNKNYQFELDKKFQITPENEIQYSSIQGKNRNEYKIGLLEEKDNLILEINENTAFSSSYFSSKGEADIGGSYDYKLTTNNFHIKGNFSSQLGINLTNCIMVSGNVLVNIGEIKKKDTVKVDQNPQYVISSFNDLWEQEILKEILGALPFDSKATVDIIRKYYVLEYYMNQVYHGESYFIGFAESEEKNEVVQQFGLDGTGIKAVVIPLDIPVNHNNFGYYPI